MHKQNNVSPVTKLSQDQTHFTQFSKRDQHEVQQHSLTSRISTASHSPAHICLKGRAPLNLQSTQAN